jgi:hypothetical protein
MRGNNLRGKIARVTVYKTGTGKVLRKYIGKVKQIHTSTGIRDSTYFTIVDRKGKEIDTLRDWLKEYETIDYVRDRW